MFSVSRVETRTTAMVFLFRVLSIHVTGCPARMTLVICVYSSVNNRLEMGKQAGL